MEDTCPSHLVAPDIFKKGSPVWVVEHGPEDTLDAGMSRLPLPGRMDSAVANPRSRVEAE